LLIVHVNNTTPYDEAQRKNYGGIGDFASQNTKKTSISWREGSGTFFALDQDGIKWMEVGWASWFGPTFWCSFRGLIHL
jgi:hypothetical protein